MPIIDRNEEIKMKKTFAQRVISCLLMLCLLLSSIPALAAAPALRAYCYSFAVETKEGSVTGFGFRMGAQYGTEPYTLSYTFAKDGGATMSGSVSGAGYVSVPGNFESGTYTFTASAKDAAGALSTAVMNVTFTVDENGSMNSSVNSAVRPEEVRVQEIKLPVSAQTMRVGDTFALSATITPDDAKNKEVSYTSTDAGIASVDENGLITAVAAGSCKIICTAKDGSGVTSECQIIVIQSVTGISLAPATLTIPVGGTYKLNPVISPENASNKEVTYISGNKAVAVVANDGTITGVDLGVVTISVASKDDPTKIASCVVTVGTPVTGVEVSPTAVELKTGAAMTLSAAVTPDNATNKTLVWSSSDTAVATVDASGRVQVWKAGTAVITASATDGSGKSASCTVTATGEDVTPPSSEPDDTTTTPPETSTPPTSDAPSAPSTTNPPAAAPSGETAYVCTEQGGLNLRTRASQSASRIKVIPQDDDLVVVTKGTTWCYVWHEGDYGYVMTKFLSIYNGSSSGSGNDAPPANGTEAQVNTEKGGLNMRAKPSQGAKRLLIIPEDGHFTVATYGSTWCYAYYKGTYGYVMTKFVKLLDEGSTETPPAEDPDDGKDDKPVTPPEDGSLYGIVTTKEGRLNLRKSASQSAGIIKRIDPGKYVKILSYGSKWCYVDYAGTKGYVMTEFLTFSGEVPEEDEKDEPAAPPVSDGDAKYAQVTTEQGRLNLRSSMSSGASIIKRIPQNAYVQVLTYGPEWCYVNYNGTKGYVMTKFLTFTGDVPSVDSGSTSTRPPESDGRTKYAQVVTEEGRLNLRSDKSQSAAIIARIPQKAYVRVLSTGATWCYVDYNGKTGYVMTKFLSFAKLAGSSEGLQPTLIKSSGNLYKEQSTSSAKLAELAAGDSVYYYSDNGAWAKVLHLGNIGYIKLDCLTLPEGVATVSGIKVYEGRTYSYENDSAVLATLSQGDTVKLLHCYGDTWWLVRLSNGIEGYVTTENNVLKISYIKYI